MIQLQAAARLRASTCKVHGAACDPLSHSHEVDAFVEEFAALAAFITKALGQPKKHPGNYAWMLDAGKHTLSLNVHDLSSKLEIAIADESGEPLSTKVCGDAAEAALFLAKAVDEVAHKLNAMSPDMRALKRFMQSYKSDSGQVIHR